MPWRRRQCGRSMVMTVSMRVGVGGNGLGNGERSGNVTFEELHGSDVCGSRGSHLVKKGERTADYKYSRRARVR